MKRLYLFLSTLMLVMAAALPFAATAQNNASIWDGGGTAYGNEVSFTTISCPDIFLPYTEDFESYTESTTASTGVQPDCWSLVQSDAPMTDANRPQLYYKSAYAHSGSYSLLLNYRGVYAMPALTENAPLNNVKLEMYLRQPKAAYQLEVGVWEDNGTFVPVATFNNSGTGVEFVECNFSSYTGNGHRIAFRNVLGDGANYNYSYNYIDDIVLTYLCEPIVPPYSENFESYTESTTASTGVQPDCWELVRTDVAMTDATQPQLYYKSTYAHSGNYSLKMGYRGVYAMPALSNDVPMNGVKLEMYLRQPNAAYQLEVGVWDGQEFVPVKRINNSSTDVERVECNFSTYTGNGHRIAFRNVLGGGANYAYSYNYIDDIVLTVCNPISLPYSENFESFTESTTVSTGVEPDCWDLVREDVAITDATRPQLYYKSSYAHSGNYSLKMGYRGVYAMPTLSEEVPMNDVRLEMYLRQPNAAYQLEVGVWDGQEFVPVKRFNNSSTDVERVECNFSTYMGNGHRIAFRNVLGGGANYAYSYNYIDDIVLTVCNPISLPYSENFESFTESTTASTGVEPDCWDLVREDVAITDATRPQLYYKSSYAHSGNYSLKMGYRGVYAMPNLSEEVPMNDVRLEMYLRQPNAAYRLEVGVWDDMAQTFEVVKLFNNSTTNVERVTCDFSSYTGNGRRIAFRNVLGGGANYDYSYNYIDDIVLTTICEPISLPYSENFDSYTESTTAATGVEPDCWSLVREDVAMTDANRPQLYYKSSYAHSGSYSLLLNYRGVYAMPTLSEEVPMNDVKLEMYLRQPKAAYCLEVGVWDDATNTFERVQLINNNTTNVERVTCDFSGYTGSGRRIAFRNVLGGGANYNYSYNYIDDIVLTPICEPISLPYSENFDSYTESTTAATGVEPDCWSLVREDVAMTDANRPQLYYKSSYAHSGSYSLLLNYRGVYAMPTLSEEVPMNDVKLEMYLRQPKAAYCLEVGVWDDATNTFERVQLINNSTTTVEQVTVDFSNYTGSGRRIAFRNVLGGGANHNYSYNYIDDIVLTPICEPISLPYSENFDSYTESTTAATGVEPDCWSLVREDVAMTDANRPQLYYKSSYAHSGSYSLLLNYRGVYAMPTLSEEVPMNDVKLEMYLRQPKAAYCLEVGVWDDATNTFEWVQQINNSTTTVEPVTVDFSNYTGNGRRIAFRNVLGGGANYNYSYNYIDDITLNVKSGAPCPGTPTVTDIDGNVYNTVQIGGQCWMRENLRTTKFANGTSIPQGFTSSSTTGYWYYPNNDSTNKETYGLLYNWKAAMHNSSSSDATPSGVQGICPNGWHIPSSSEFTILKDYVSGQNEYLCGDNNTYIAKSLAATTGWDISTSTCAVGNDQSSNNATGFSVMPAGYWQGGFGGFGSLAYFWSSTEQSVSNANLSRLSSNFVSSSEGNKGNSYSVRCLRNEDNPSYLPTVTTNTITTNTPISAIGGGNITFGSNVPVISQGVCWSTSHNPTIKDSHTIDGTETGNFTSELTGLQSNFTYYVRAYATNFYGTVYGNEVSFTTSVNPNGDELSCLGTPTVIDIDGNVYNTVQIGGQCWMRENLRTTRYTDGISIVQSDYRANYPCWCYPAGIVSYKQTYGLLYNWSAVMHENISSNTTPSNVQGICPMGWHVPSSAEWKQLKDYVSGQSQYWCGDNSDYIAKALASTTGWESSISVCYAGNDLISNNSTGFGAMPTGYGLGMYNYFGSNVYFWSTTERSTSFANVWSLSRTLDEIDGYKADGFSVRCIRDEGQAQFFPTVTTNSVSDVSFYSATCGGNVISTGDANVTAKGLCWSINHNPDLNDSHITNGSGIGSFSFNLTELSSNHTYYVRAYATNNYGTVYGNEVSFTTPINLNGDEHSCLGTPIVTDIDGNVYNTVQIGDQCWMRENLRTSRYSDGTAISQNSYASTTVSRWSYPAGDSIHKLNYGLLYNWKAVMRNAPSSDINPSGVKGICPIGWHVPSDAEWIQLTNYVGSHSEYVCSNNNANITKALAANIGWRRNSTSGCSIGNNLSNNNSTWFSALPAGWCENESYHDFSSATGFWSSTESNSNRAYSCWLHTNNKEVYISSPNKYSQYSVRCLRDENNVVIDEKSCPAAPTVTDHEGNVYATVQIGDQCWMRDNLRTTYFANGVAIELGDTTGNTPLRYNPNNDESNVPIYGYLYNFHAVIDTQNICPSGWHVPSYTEWSQLTLEIGSEFLCAGNPNNVAKALASTSGWDSCMATCAVGNAPESNNSTGFSALPAGKYYNNYSSEFGKFAYYWSSTSNGGAGGKFCGFYYCYSDMYKSAFSEKAGFSVRCLRDAPSVVIDEKSCPAAPTVTDHEGNVYATVQIGNQCWMRDNLRTTTSPSTGTYLIPTAGTGYTHTGKQAFWYNNDSTTYAPMNYGLLYNWNAAIDTFNTAFGETSVNTNSSNAVSVNFTGYRQGICPAGWHLPSDAEWTQLTNFVGSQSEYVCGDTNINIAKALASTEGWNTYGGTCVVGNDPSANNATGFGVVPAGDYWDDGFANAGIVAFLWSSTEYAGYSDGACTRYLNYIQSDVDRVGHYKYNGFSVRCLRDNTNNKSDESNEDPNTAIPDNTSLEMANIDASLSVKEFTDASVNVILYPNPTRDYINVQCTMNDEPLEMKGIEVIDVYGKVVRTVVGANNYSPTQINVSGLAAGMYFVRVTTDQGAVTKTFVKK